MLSRLRNRSQDLSLIWSGVTPTDRLRWDLGRYQPHSWLCFAIADPFLVERGSWGAACRRRIGVDGSLIRDGRICGAGRPALDRRSAREVPPKGVRIVLFYVVVYTYNNHAYLHRPNSRFVSPSPRGTPSSNAEEPRLCTLLSTTLFGVDLKPVDGSPIAHPPTNTKCEKNTWMATVQTHPFSLVSRRSVDRGECDRPHSTPPGGIAISGGRWLTLNPLFQT